MYEKEVIKRMGKKNWQKFIHFMRGQTCEIYSDENTNYYECDVENVIKKSKNKFFD